MDPSMQFYAFATIFVAVICVSGAVNLQDLMHRARIQNTATVEKPLYDHNAQMDMYNENKPDEPPANDSDEYKELEDFSQKVQLILQVVNENEYQAAVTYMKAPTEDFDRAVIFPRPNIIVGLFAGIETALLQADVGANVGPYVEEAIKIFPNALYVISTGVCYAFRRDRVNFADVLVSEQISDLTNMKFAGDDSIVNRGQTVNVIHDLNALFCMNLLQSPPFQVAENRYSNVYSGRMVSYPVLMDNLVMRGKFYQAVQEAIGGEMEGGELLELQQEGKIHGVIVIKGVVDYADGTKTKGWQFTAALAALHYIQSKLLDVISLSVVDHE